MADTNTTGLTAASALTGSELVHVVQGGNSRKAALQAIGPALAQDFGYGFPRNTLDALSTINPEMLGNPGLGNPGHLDFTVTASQSGTTVTISSTATGFSKEHVGAVIRWASGHEAVILEVNNSPTWSNVATCTVDRSQTVSLGSATVKRRNLVGVTYGDSVGHRINAPLARALWRACGFGGIVQSPGNVEENYGTNISSCVLAGGATQQTTDTDYDAHPWSNWWALPAGGTATFGFQGETVVGSPLDVANRDLRHGLSERDLWFDTTIVIWRRQAGAFVVERKRKYDASWELAATVADASTGSQFYASVEVQHALGFDWQYRIRSTSGTIELVSVTFANKSAAGFLFWPLSRGGRNLTDFDALPAAQLAQLCQIHGQPDFRWICSADADDSTDQLVYEARIAADRALWAAAAPRCDHIWAEQWDTDIGDDRVTARNAAIRNIALSNGDPYVPLHRLLGDFTTASSRIGWIADGVHTSDKGNIILGYALLKQLGISDFPGLKRGGDVAGKRGDFEELTLDRRSVSGQLKAIRDARPGPPRGAMWGFNNCRLQTKTGIITAPGTAGDFTYMIDYDFGVANVLTQARYLLVLSTSPDQVAVAGSLEVQYSASDIRIYLIDGSGNAYLYEVNDFEKKYGAGRHTLVVRSDRANNRFDVFVDGQRAVYLSIAATGGSGVDLATWNGTGTGIGIPQGNGDAHRDMVYSAMLWGSRLSDDEIAGNFEAGWFTSTVPLFAYDFSEGVGRRVVDRSGNGRHAWFGSSNPVKLRPGIGPVWKSRRSGELGPLFVVDSALDSQNPYLLGGDNLLVQNAITTTYRLPDAPEVGELIRVTKATTSTISITQPSLTQIKTGAGGTIGTNATTIGTGGKIQFAGNHGSVTLMCTRADGGVAFEWTVVGQEGGLTWT